MLQYLPSPTLSACDSLADVDDLDAFLESHGRLSRWPTPPLPSKEDILVAMIECASDEAEDDVDDCTPDIVRVSE